MNNKYQDKEGGGFINMNTAWNETARLRNNLPAPVEA